MAGMLLDTGWETPVQCLGCYWEVIGFLLNKGRNAPGHWLRGSSAVVEMFLDTDWDAPGQWLGSSSQWEEQLGCGEGGMRSGVGGRRFV